MSLFQLFRKSYTFYWKTYIKPFIVLPGIVEIDETKISRQRWHFRGGFPKKIRWVFGLFCRSTGITIVYEIHSKSHDYLVNIVKKHVQAGTVMMSDHHSSYVIMRASKSNLTRYGFFHFWINHSAYYVHEKFTFLQTASIENQWLRMRHQMMALKMQQSSERIDEYLNTFMLMNIIQQ